MRVFQTRRAGLIPVTHTNTTRIMRLHQTCGACPEQYDVYHGKRKVGYLRLRHGRFTVRYFSVSKEESELVYHAQTKGDGMFEEDERGFHLDKAIAALRARMRRDEPPYKT